MKKEDALPPRSRIGDFEILRVLGQGASAITYFARDLRSDGRKVAIKEYFPLKFAQRTPRGAVESRDGNTRIVFDRLLSRFREEGELLGLLNHPNLGSRFLSIPANGTVYHVMKYETGTSLKDLLRRQDVKLQKHPDRILKITKGLLDGLENLHASGYLHCDIKPSNIFIGADWKPVIIDMGSALALGPTGVLARESIEWTDHYAPGELLRMDSIHIGPWTDLYSVGAVLYRCASGGKIPKTEERAFDFDPYMKLAEISPKGFGLQFMSAVDAALMPKWKDRPRSVDEFRELLGPRWIWENRLHRAMEVGSKAIRKGRDWAEKGKRRLRNH